VKQWLVELLKDGPAEAAEGWRLAAEMGFAEKTVRRAVKDLGVVSRPSRHAEHGHITGHTWELPPRPERQPF
jgi:hypothetical protein